MRLKGYLIDKFTVFKRKTSMFLDKLESKLLQFKSKFNDLIDNVLDIVAMMRDIVDLKIENYRINKIVRLTVHIGKIKNKIGYQ